MSINHEARIRTLETARVAADGQSESIGTKLAALQEKVAGLEARVLSLEVDNEKLRDDLNAALGALRGGPLPDHPEESRKGGRPSKNPA